MQEQVALEMIFRVSIVDADLIDKQKLRSKSYDDGPHFIESLMRSLRLCVPFENLKAGPRARSTSETKRKLADHQLEKKKEFDHDIRRRCVAYFETNREEQQSREACHAITPRRINKFLF